MISIFTLRPHGVTGKLYKKFLNIEVPTIQKLFNDYAFYLNKIKEELGESELYNIYYHLGHIDRKVDHKKLVYQNVIAFDIDKIDYSRTNEYIKILARVTKTDPSKCVILESGNGLHYIILVPSFKGEDHAKTRQPYNKLMLEIKAELTLSKLQGNCDPLANKYNATLRFPNTTNRKPTKDPLAPDANITFCKLLNHNIEMQNFNLDDWRVEEISDESQNKLSGDNVNKELLTKYSSFNPDIEYIFNSCDFLGAQLKNGGKNANEPQWYAALGIVGYFNDPEFWATEISKGHPDFNEDELQEKLKQAIAIKPRTCGYINTLWDGCQKCTHFTLDKSPIGLNRYKSLKKNSSIGIDIGIDKEEKNFLEGPIDNNPKKGCLEKKTEEENTNGEPLEIYNPPSVVASSPEENIPTFKPWWQDNLLLSYRFQAKNPDMTIEELLKKGFTVPEYNRYGKIKKYHRDHNAMIQYMSLKLPFINIPSIDRIMVYRGKKWEIGFKDEFLCFANAEYEFPKPSVSELKDFKNKALMVNVGTMDFFNQNHNCLNFQNGVLNLDTDQFLPHSPIFGFQYVYPFDYQAQASECPVWDELMGHLTLDRPNLQNVLEQFFGYIFYGGDYIIQKVLILSGKGANGKTTLFNILQKIIGRENSSAVYIKDFEKPFEIVHMEGKLANISEEASRESLMETSAFKALSGDSDISIARKFENSYKFKNKAKLMISYNETPFLKDLSDGMKRRLLIVPFECDYDKNPERKILDIDIKIIPEIPAIFNRCLKKFKEVLKTKNLTETQESKDQLAEVIRNSSPETCMLEECVEYTPDPNTKITSRELFAKMLEYQPDYKINSHSFSCKISNLIKSKWDLKPQDIKVKKDGKDSVSKGYRHLKFKDSSRNYSSNDEDSNLLLF